MFKCVAIAVILLVYGTTAFSCWRSQQLSLDEAQGGADADTDVDSDTDSDIDTGPEEPPACVFYVDAESAFGGDGTTWESAVDTVQEGIEHAGDMLDEFDVCHVWVAEGIYYIYQDSIEDTLQLRAGVHVYGGFAGNETLLSERDWKAHPTVLSGHEDQDSPNTVCSVVTGADDSVLDGFVVTDGGCYLGWYRGGGMRNQSVSPTVRNCDFVANRATEGAGMASWDGSAPLVENCGFYDNWIDPGGGGGGMSAENTSLTLINCRFIGNVGDWGSAIMFNEATSDIVNCVFTFNTTHDLEGHRTIDNNQTATRLVSSVFYNNEGVALRNRQEGFAEVSSSVFWDHPGGTITSDDESGALVEFSVIQGGYSGVGNTSENPLFVAPEEGDFHLQPNSPCIDAANGDEVSELDLDGNPRVDDPNTPNTGLGPPWADIGAYEYQP